VGFADYLSTNPAWQVIVVPRATFTLEASKQPGSDLHPTKLESGAGRASSFTTVPTGKNALQVPSSVPLPRTMVQSIPAGCEMTRPLPFPPGRIAMLPLEKWKGSHTVITACLSVLKTPPTVPMITAATLEGVPGRLDQPRQHIPELRFSARRARSRRLSWRWSGVCD
jgi:hypothetical protein